MAENLPSAFSRRQFFALGGGAASAVLLTSCGAGGAGESAAGGAGGPQQGGNFTFSLPAGVNETLDLHKSQDPATFRYVTPLLSKLVEFKTGPDLAQSYELTADLAREWEIADDGLTYTFHLRDDVTWHDIPPVSGRPFTSDDVLATFETIVNRPADHAWMFERVDSFEAPDDFTFVVRMKQVYAPFETYMAHPWNVILPREHVEGKFDIKTVTIGTGPFMLDGYKRGEQMIRVRNPNYFIKGKPYLDELTSVVVPEQNAAIAAFQSGRVNTTRLPGERIAKFKEMPDVKVTDGGMAPVTLNLQTQREPFTDLRVRRAVALAINFEGLGEAVYPGQWALSSVIPPSSGEFALPPEEIRKVRPHDPEQASRLLAEAGLPDGFRTTIMVQKLDPQDVQGAEYMVQDLRKVGIEVELQVLDAATAVQRRIDGNFDMAKAARGISMADAYLSDYESGARLNYSRVADEKLDQMIVKSREILDHDERVAHMHDIARYMETDIAAVLYGVAYIRANAIHANVHNYHPHQMITGRWWADVWIGD